MAAHHLALSEEWLNKDLDSALTHALASQKHFSRLTSVELKSTILNNLGDVYKSKGEPAMALKFYLRSKLLVDEATAKHPGDGQLKLLKVDVHLRIGTLYLQLKNFRRAIFCYENALTILEKAGPKVSKADLSLRKLKVYNNMAAVFIQQEDYETALIYFRNALELNKTVKDQAYESSILNNIGICHMEKKELDLASHYFQKTLKIRKAAGDKQGCAQVLNNIAKNEVYQGNVESAAAYFEQALALSREIGSKQSALISLESLSTLNETMGNYRESLRYYRQYKLLNDSIFNSDSQTAIASLEEKHKRENERKKYELKLQKNESDRLKSQFTTLMVVATLVLLLLGALLFIISMRNRVKNSRLEQEKLTLERENLDLVRKTLQENLEFKERELVANALFIHKNNELITRVKDTLLKAKSSFTKENQQLIQEIITDLRLNQHNQAWDEFELHFTKVHSQFYQSLQEKFPNLTSNELKLCAFLRLNMSTKDISAITNQTVNSITVARSRLRKKLNIDGEDVHLINFLLSL
ncbi:MAG TPA: tetratricopeptide repeat protein [Fluviicola sp.]|nr:tetratricopeptide repeat protein [Fluviicola sp.]